jgi:2-dehydro-3-deoxyphosphogluconate aldolase / (4S)-4-hydroxy-2-oxoglutarate aldolase
VNVLDELARQRMLPVLRCADAQDALETARAAAEAGCRVVELTLSTPGVREAISPLVGEGLVVAVGTVRAAAEVPSLAAAGAAIVVSFSNPPGFVAAAEAAGVPAIPGGLTPSELAAADNEGAAAVKLFPASLTEPDYLVSLRPVLPSLRLVVTGGIAPTPESMQPWLEAGALAVGIGSALGSAATVGRAEVTRRCREALRAAGAS